MIFYNFSNNFFLNFILYDIVSYILQFSQLLFVKNVGPDFKNIR